MSSRARRSVLTVHRRHGNCILRIAFPGRFSLPACSALSRPSLRWPRRAASL